MKVFAQTNNRERRQDYCGGYVARNTQRLAYLIWRQSTENGSSYTACFVGAGSMSVQERRCRNVIDHWEFGRNWT